MWPPSGEPASDPSRRRGVSLVATAHPSAVLRADNQETAYKELVSDLQLVARLLG
jgi:DNA polymerase